MQFLRCIMVQMLQISQPKFNAAFFNQQDLLLVLGYFHFELVYCAGSFLICSKNMQFRFEFGLCISIDRFIRKMYGGVVW